MAGREAYMALVWGSTGLVPQRGACGYGYTSTTYSENNFKTIDLVSASRVVGLRLTFLFYLMSSRLAFKREIERTFLYILHATPFD